MNANFWTTQNIIILSVAMLAIPTGGGAALHLLKKSKKTEVVEVAPPVPPPRPQPKPKPIQPVATEPAEKGNQRDEAFIDRFTKRIQSTTSQSNLSKQGDRIRKAVKVADKVELIHTVNFNPGSLRLDLKDENYLASALQSNEQFRKHRRNPNATLVVLGYASKDGDSRNNRFAMTRAKSVVLAIRDHEAELGFSGSVKTWSVGETNLLSEEAGASCSQHNRAAEIWLIVDNDRLLQQVQSDDFVEVKSKAANCKKH